MPKRNTYRRKQRQQLYQLKAWKDLSQYLRQINPVCQDCGEQLTSDVHHLISPFTEGLNKYEALKLLLDPDNCICLCRECHNKRHENVKKTETKEWKSPYLR